MIMIMMIIVNGNGDDAELIVDTDITTPGYAEQLLMLDWIDNKVLYQYDFIYQPNLLQVIPKILFHREGNKAA